MRLHLSLHAEYHSHENIQAQAEPVLKVVMSRTGVSSSRFSGAGFGHEKATGSTRLAVAFAAAESLSAGAQYLLQLAALVHFHHDVGAANEFALDVKLGDRRPVAVFLDALADRIVLDRKSTRLNSSHRLTSRMPSSA
jgi:hypothetical protein